MKQLAKERTGANDQNSFYKLNPDVSDLPDKLAKDINGVKLLVMGTVDTGGTGCVCPEHVMLKAILTNLVFRKDDVVIMDMEAGLEHLGRGTASMMDQFIVVIEPGARSVQTYVRIKELAARHRHHEGARRRQQDPRRVRPRIYPQPHPGGGSARFHQLQSRPSSTRTAKASLPTTAAPTRWTRSAPSRLPSTPKNESERNETTMKTLFERVFNGSDEMFAKAEEEVNKIVAEVGRDAPLTHALHRLFLRLYLCLHRQEGHHDRRAAGRAGRREGHDAPRAAHATPSSSPASAPPSPPR